MFFIDNNPFPHPIRDGQIVNRKFCKTVIRSVASLTYAEAQILIDDTNRVDPLSEGLRGLNELAKKLKQQRIEAGALTLASPEVTLNYFDCPISNNACVIPSTRSHFKP